MQINYAGKVSKDEFLKALFLQNKQYRVYKWVLGIVLAFFALSILYMTIQGAPELDTILQYAFPGGLIPLVAMTFPWWSPYLQLSAYDQPGNIYLSNVFGLIDENRITINGGQHLSGTKFQTMCSYFIKGKTTSTSLQKTCSAIKVIGKNLFLS
ncbi:MAG: hypothetical protein CVU39_14270 [Chloroflexi bacterium HGW-Chloroflexi-10]|nr:MAG: hypothetical protein CVU39_14270 [Chloroflexi bacterium HGW-Chloroflexi-10]